jgi:hypothetical protein
MHGKGKRMGGNGNGGNGNGQTAPEKSDAELVRMIRQIVEEHGCTIVNIDLGNQILNIDGPEEAQVACAIALGHLLGE